MRPRRRAALQIAGQLVREAAQLDAAGPRVAAMKLFFRFFSRAFFLSPELPAPAIPEQGSLQRILQGPLSPEQMRLRKGPVLLSAASPAPPLCHYPECR